MHSKRHRRSASDSEGCITTDEADSMTQDRIARTGVLRKRGGKQKICGGAKGRKYKRAACAHCEQSEQGDCEEAVYQDVERPHQAGRKVMEQPCQLQALEQDR